MGFSSPGKRNEQQDSYKYHIQDDEVTAVVSDGMGGLNGGELASRYAVNRFIQDYNTRIIEQKINDFLKTEVVLLDDAVFQMKNSTGKQLGAGTTIVAAIIQENHLHWLSVGDSKLYVYRNQRLRCMTREHNYRMVLDEMLENQCISEQAYREEMKHADGLISFLGMGNVKVFDVNERPFEIKSGDRYLLCSDGVYKTIPEDMLEELLQKYSDTPEELIRLMQHLIDDNDIEDQDNATVIMLTMDE